MKKELLVGGRDEETVFVVGKALCEGGDVGRLELFLIAVLFVRRLFVAGGEMGCGYASVKGVPPTCGHFGKWMWWS